MSNQKTYPLHRLIPYKNASKVKQLLLTKKFKINEKNEDGKSVLILACAIENNDEILEVLFQQDSLDVDVEDNDGNKALHYLAWNGNTKFISLLTEKFPGAAIDPENTHGDTPLIMAARMDRVDVISDLHKKGANINHQNKRGLTALHCAASSGYIKSTRLLISLGACLSTDGEPISIIDWGFQDINDIFMGKEKYPIHEAVSCGNMRKLKILLHKGAFDINEENDAGKTALQIAADLPNNDEILELLLSQPSIDITRNDANCCSVLHTLASRGKLEVMRNILEKFPDILIDAQNVFGDTPLILATKMNHSDVVEYLYGKGAEVNMKNNQGLTALHIAAMNGYLESTGALIKAGAQLSVRDNYGCTPLSMSMRWGFEDVTEILRSRELYPLHTAVMCRNMKKLKHLVQLNAFDINVCDNAAMPLLVLAAENNDDDILSLLLDHKDIDPLLPDKDGYTILHVLALNGKLETIKSIFEKFPDINVDIQNQNQETPLITAAKRDHADIIRYLLEKGANINHQNVKNYTALHYAANNNCLESAQLLVELGADIQKTDNYGCVPLQCAAHWGFLDLTAMLLQVGGKEHINFTNRHGETALWKAVYRGKIEVVALLLDEGAEINPPHKQPNPLARACKNGDVVMAKYLLQRGADVNILPSVSKQFLNQHGILY